MKFRVVLSLLFLLLAAITTSSQQTSTTSQSEPPAQKETSAVSQTSGFAVEQALKILNDSDLAQTIKPSLQDAPCSYQNPAFPSLFLEDKGAIIDARSPSVTPLQPVTPDDSEYLVRFQSAEPVQAAVGQLLAMGEEWSAYGIRKIAVRAEEGPTNLSISHYNVADMITIAVILKRAGSDRTSLFNYGYEQDGHIFPSRSVRLWPCAGLRTSNGEVFARLFGDDGKPNVMQLSFPRLIGGKPLISDPHQKVEFRLVINQRVFETTFVVDPGDVLDGSEKVLYLPPSSRIKPKSSK
jgi:hypothetical protein